MFFFYTSMYKNTRFMTALRIILCSHLCKTHCIPEEDVCWHGHAGTPLTTRQHSAWARRPPQFPLLQWLFQMRRPKAEAPVAVRQSVARWHCPLCALACVALLCWESFKALLLSTELLFWLGQVLSQSSDRLTSVICLECSVKGSKPHD